MTLTRTVNGSETTTVMLFPVVSAEGDSGHDDGRVEFRPERSPVITDRRAIRIPNYPGDKRSRLERDDERIGIRVAHEIAHGHHRRDTLHELDGWRSLPDWAGIRRHRRRCGWS